MVIYDEKDCLNSCKTLFTRVNTGKNEKTQVDTPDLCIDIEYIDRALSKKIVLLHRGKINGCSNS